MEFTLNLQKCFKKYALVLTLIISSNIFWLFLLFVGLHALPSQRELAEDFYVSPTFYDRNDILFHARLSYNEEWLLPVPLSRMGKWLPLIAITVEDKRFYEHQGVDLLALMRALWQNAKSGKVISGASTISSQVLRLSVGRERSIKTKILEFVQAVKLEQELSKDEILELYLNRAPFGGPLRGVEAAARQYFYKSAAQLSLAESAMLVALLRGPTYYRPDRKPELIKERRDKILDLLMEQGLVSLAELNLFKAELIPSGRAPMPAMARHYSDLVLNNLSLDVFKWSRNKKNFGIHCSLDFKEQQALESALRMALTDFSPEITAAAAIMDNQSGELLSYVGNIRYAHGENKSWIDCAQAPRSPGSILKPFIYLAAFEKGLYSPASLLADSSLALSGRAPRNFDEKYRGPVSARFALAHSLNAPSVRVLRQVGYQESLNWLRRLGFELLSQDSNFYGDSLVIGGCEVTLLQVLRAYSSLARLGIDKKIRLTSEFLPKKHNNNQVSAKVLETNFNLSIQNKPKNLPENLPEKLSEVPLYSEAAAWLVADILKDSSRLSPAMNLLNIDKPMPIAFKTGTSYGLRDAWCAAYSPKYTIVVWLGDQTGKPNAKLIGLKAAAPVAVSFLRKLTETYQTQNAILQNNLANNSFDASVDASVKRASNQAASPRNNQVNNQVTYRPVYPYLGLWYAKAREIESYKACALSGQSAGPNCLQVQTSWRIAKVTQTVPCTVHSRTKNMVEITWPTELADFAARRTEKTEQTTKLNIVSPLPNSKIFMSSKQKLQKILLNCEGSNGTLYWYLDKEFFAKQQNGEKLFLTLSPGKHSLAVMDDTGRSGKTEFQVLEIDSVVGSEALLPVLNFEITRFND